MTTRTTEYRNTNSPAHTLEKVGAAVIRYGLAIVLLWVGLLKFTAYEAEGIQGLVANSLFFSWAYGVFSVRTFSAIIGTLEIVLGLMILTRPVAPRIAAFGSLEAIVMFLTKLTFLLTTPGVWQPGYGFPSLSPMPGQFIAKDLVFLGAALWTAGEALRAANQGDLSASRS